MIRTRHVFISEFLGICRTEEADYRSSSDHDCWWMKKSVLNLGVLALATSVRAFSSVPLAPAFNRALPSTSARFSSLRGGKPTNRPPFHV